MCATELNCAYILTIFCFNFHLKKKEIWINSLYINPNTIKRSGMNISILTKAFSHRDNETLTKNCRKSWKLLDFNWRSCAHVRRRKLLITLEKTGQRKVTMQLCNWISVQRESRRKTHFFWRLTEFLFSSMKCAFNDLNIDESNLGTKRTLSIQAHLSSEMRNGK